MFFHVCQVSLQMIWVCKLLGNWKKNVLSKPKPVSHLKDKTIIFF